MFAVAVVIQFVVLFGVSVMSVLATTKQCLCNYVGTWQ